MLPKFVELDSNLRANDYYITTNESLFIHLQLIDEAKKLKPIKKVGGICSGGEVPLFVLLPKADEVTVIDRSYNCLFLTQLKVAFLEKHSVEQIQTFLKGTSEDLYGVLKELAQDLSLNDHKTLYRSTTSNYSSTFEAAFSSAASKSSGIRSIKDLWQRIESSHFAEVKEKLSCLTLVHGDLLEIGKLGEFDLLYLSNAIGYYYTPVRDKNFKKITKALENGGFALYTSWRNIPSLDGVTHLKTENSSKIQCGELSWSYHLGRRDS